MGESEYPVEGFGATGVPGSANAKFEVAVIDPDKHGEGMNAYISYKIITKTTMENYDQHDFTPFTVERRYKDFLWLYEELRSNYKGVIIPPLPDKQALGTCCCCCMRDG